MSRDRVRPWGRADLLLPVVGIGEQSHWRLDGNAAQAGAAVLIAFGWLLGFTVVAAVTRVVKRS